MATKKAKVSDLKTDSKNFNKHTQFGTSLLEKSLREFGGARSILIDKNNKIIAGNATAEAAAAIGLENLEVIETDGQKIIAVKRTDIDIDTKRGRRMALADNMTALKNIDIDVVPVVEALGEEVAIEFGMVENASDYLQTGDDGEQMSGAPRKSDFLIVMKHTNKKRLIEKIDRVNAKFQLNSVEESLMKIVDAFKI